MIIGKLTLIKDTLPHTFGDFRYVIEQDGVELVRIPSTIREDLILAGVNTLDIFYEISRLIRNTINNPELNGDIDDISDMIAFKKI